MTGGGFGSCGAPIREADADIRGFGRGAWGGGRGLRRGFRRGFCFIGRGRGWAEEPIPPDRTSSNLQAEAESLRARLEAVEKRLAGIETLGGETKGA